MSATIQPRPRPQITPRNRPQSNGSGVTKPPRHVSQEGRQRLSEIATERHKRGDFDPKRNGKPKKARKPSKARIAQRVAAAAAEKKNAQNIIDVFKDGIASKQPMQIRLKAAEAWLRVDDNDAKLDLKRAVAASESMDRDQALDYLAKALSGGHAAELVRSRAAALDDDAIPGTATDVD